MRLLVAAGGTGGHVAPALAIVRGVRSREGSGAHILWVRAGRPAERDFLEGEEGIEVRTLDVAPLARGLRLSTVLLPARLLRALWQSFRLVREFRPDVVLGTGGYVAGPVLLAAVLAGCPTLLHESNALPGLTTRLLAGIVREVHVAFPEAQDRLPRRARVHVTGTPVGRPAGPVDREAARAKWGLDPLSPVLLVTGGSQGARALTRTLVAVWESWEGEPPCQLLLQTGVADQGWVSERAVRWRGRAVVASFFAHMEEIYPIVDLAVARAGAATVAELAHWGVPSILVPYPHAAAGHQEWNARALARGGGARVLAEAELTPGRLRREIEAVLADGPARARMAEAARGWARPDAAAVLVARLQELAGGPGR